MLTWFHSLRRFHSFLARQGLYPILLATLLACALFAGRVYLTERLDKSPPVSPQASTSPDEDPLQFGALRVIVKAWRDDYERSFVRGWIELSMSHSLPAYRGAFERPGKLGVLRVFLSSWGDANQRALVRILAELSLRHTLIYSFLIWNLFLAWIPYLCSLWAAHLHQRHPDRWWYLLMPGVLWLLFFPNAPYILTDFLHLRARAPIPIWYDIGMLSVFAWTGLFLAVYSLYTMQTLVRAFLASVASWLFVLGSLGLGGLGVYIGRFLRWNSWDLLVQPHSVLTDVAIRLANPGSYPGTLGVTLLFAAFLLVCYLTLTTISGREQA